MENSMDIPWKIKMEQPDDQQFHSWVFIQSVTLIGKDMQSKYSLQHFYNSQNMEETQVSIQRWLKKKWYIYIYIHTHTHTHMNISHKKEQNLSICNTWINLEYIIPSERSQRQILYNLTYMWKLRTKTDEQT